jgi:hypothetical protein
MSEQITEREAIVKMVKHDFGAAAVRMMLASGVPIGTRTERVKGRAFADGFARAVSVIADAIERGEHQKDINEN